MKQAPSVFVPTRPEGDGLTVPVLLSVLAHGLLIGFVIFTHQPPELETAASIETTMVSPEQLAEMQAQILANRAASGGQSSVSASEDAIVMPSSPDQSFNSNNSGSLNSSQGSSVNSAATTNRPAIFERSDSPADSQVDDGILLSREHRLKIQQANAEYERKMAALAEQIDEAIANKDNALLDEARERERIRQARVDELKKIEKSGPMIKRPTTDSKNSTNKGAASDSINIGLSDGTPIATGSTTGKSSASSGSPSKSVGEYKSAIAKKIQRNLQAPIGTQGIKATVNLRLDASGNVLSANASGSNPEVNSAAEQAALNASPLPIDFDNPDAYANLRINVVVE